MKLNKIIWMPCFGIFMGTVCVQGSFAKPSAQARVEVTQQCRTLYNTYRALEVRANALRQLDQLSEQFRAADHERYAAWLLCKVSG